MTRSFSPVACGLLLVCCWFPIFSAQAGNAIDIELKTGTMEGVDSPGLTLIVREDLPQVTLELNDSNGKKISRRFSDLKTGTAQHIEISQKPGTMKYQGRLTVDFGGGEQGAMPLAFALTVLPGLSLKVLPERFDLASQTLYFTLNRPVSRLEWTIIGDNGEELGQGQQLYPEGRADEPTSMTWTQKDGVVLRIDLTAHDREGAFSSVKISPWSVEVEHEEVHFASGRHEIQDGERSKLDATYAKLQQAVQRYGKLIQLNLYIAGYTDTVGEKSYNLALSLRRARSIAAYFRHKGFRFPIKFQGFGEDVPAVSTPDETDMQANRRAIYVLAGDFSPAGPDIPRQNWVLLDD